MIRPVQNIKSYCFKKNEHSCEGSEHGSESSGILMRKEKSRNRMWELLIHQESNAFPLLKVLKVQTFLLRYLQP